MSTYIWSEFKARTLLFVTDRTPADTNFVAAVTDYVRARIARDIMGDANGYGMTEKRYTSLRRGLAGFNTTLSDAALKAAVRVLLSEGARTNEQVVQAVALYVRAETAREIDSRGDVGPEAALTIHKSCKQDYALLRIRLCGFHHTLAAGLAAEVAKFIPLDAERLGSETVVATLEAAAVEDIEAFGDWLDQQILTAKDDVQSLNDRIQLELRAAVIDLQTYIRAYTVGHETTFTEDDVLELGNASLGTLPDGAQVRSAKVERTDVPETELTRFDRCSRVEWDKRDDTMIQSLDCAARLAIDPKGVTFLVTPRLTFARPQLIITWDGTKLDFEDDDSVPFDEGAAQAVAYKVNSALAVEWGESVSQVQVWLELYVQERSKLYLRNKLRAEVRA